MPSGELPVTGPAAVVLAGIGVALVVVGGLIIRASRARNCPEPATE